MNDVGRAYQGEKQGPSGKEAVVERFEKDRCIWSRKLGKGEENLCLSRVGHGWLFHQDVFARTDGPNSPFIVQSVGEGDEDTLDGTIIEDV